MNASSRTVRSRCSRACLVFVAAFALSLGLPAAATPKDDAVATVDLAALIECRASIADYMALGAKLGPQLDGAALGWSRVKQPNPFITEFQLAKAVRVFGLETKRVALGGSGVLAIFGKQQTTPPVLAKKLGLQPVPVGSQKTIFAKVVKDDSDAVASVIIRLNVSTVDSHPGQTLAGCEYQVSVK